MLKHRYNSLSESISDFDRMLDGMNGVQPLERKRVDEDLLDLLRDEQELIRLEQQIDHLHRAIFGSGMPISESEVKGLQQAHAAAAAKYDAAAAKTIEKIKALSAAHDAAMKEKMLGLKTRFQLKAKEHGALASGPEKKKELTASVNESVQPPRHGKMAVYRRLAGIEEMVQMPRDPGVLGTTRFNAEYDEMAKPFDEAEVDYAGLAAKATEVGAAAYGASNRARETGEKRHHLAAAKAHDKAFDAHQVALKAAPRGSSGSHEAAAEKHDYRAGNHRSAAEMTKADREGYQHSESYQIEDRIREIREGRSKEQQHAGLKASFHGGHNLHRPTDVANKELTKDDVRLDDGSPRVKRALRQASGRDNPHERSADLLTHKQNVKSWPDGENIVKGMTKRGVFLGQYGRNLSSIRPRRPKDVDQQESLSIEDRIREIREGRSKDWSDAKITAHKKKMKNVARKIHQAGDEIDREYGVEEDVPDVSRGIVKVQGGKIAGPHGTHSYRMPVSHSNPVSKPKGAVGPQPQKLSGGKIGKPEPANEEAKQWAADAVKRPGRLHKYFGIPADQKIPMSKIKTAYNKLKDKEDKSAEETSLMRALALGIRFKGGDVPGGEKKSGLAGEGVEVAEARTKAMQHAGEREMAQRAIGPGMNMHQDQGTTSGLRDLRVDKSLAASGARDRAGVSRLKREPINYLDTVRYRTFARHGSGSAPADPLATRARIQKGKSSRELVREKSADLRREKLSKLSKNY